MQNTCTLTIIKESSFHNIWSMKETDLILEITALSENDTKHLSQRLLDWEKFANRTFVLVKNVSNF